MLSYYEYVIVIVVFVVDRLGNLIYIHNFSLAGSLSEEFRWVYTVLFVHSDLMLGCLVTFCHRLKLPCSIPRMVM